MDFFGIRKIERYIFDTKNRLFVGKFDHFGRAYTLFQRRAFCSDFYIVIEQLKFGELNGRNFFTLLYIAWFEIVISFVTAK